VRVNRSGQGENRRQRDGGVRDVVGLEEVADHIDAISPVAILEPGVRQAPPGVAVANEEIGATDLPVDDAGPGGGVPSDPHVIGLPTDLPIASTIQLAISGLNEHIEVLVAPGRDGRGRNRHAGALGGAQIRLVPLPVEPARVQVPELPSREQIDSRVSPAHGGDA